MSVDLNIEELIQMSKLRVKITEILKNVMGDELSKILDEEALKNYWNLAFTHKSLEVEKNNGMFIFIGNNVLPFIFSQYIYSEFRDRLNEEKANLLLNKFMAHEFQANMIDRLGLMEYIKFNPDYNIDKAKGHIFKAFFGCLNSIIDDRFKPHHGYIYCYELLKILLTNTDISTYLDEIRKDTKTELKELHEKMGWSQPTYIINDDPDHDPDSEHSENH